MEFILRKGNWVADPEAYAFYEGSYVNQAQAEHEFVMEIMKILATPCPKNWPKIVTLALQTKKFHAI